jgi:hypothetical protein
MQIIQLLSAATAFSIILLEVYSGVIQGPIWWVWPGGLVLSLLIALLRYAPELVGATKQAQPPGFFSQTAQLLIILAIAFGASYFRTTSGASTFRNCSQRRGGSRRLPGRQRYISSRVSRHDGPCTFRGGRFPPLRAALVVSLSCGELRRRPRRCAKR